MAITLLGLALVLLPGQAPAGPTPPLVGRPVDFSGLIGGPFQVEWEIGKNEVLPRATFRLILRVRGPGNLDGFPRPDLAKLPGFQDYFITPPLEGPAEFLTPGPVPEKAFHYLLQPRKTGPQRVPRFKLVYFNPALHAAGRGFQTTYADPIAFTVQAWPQPSPDYPPDVPAGMETIPAWPDLAPSPPDSLFHRGLDRVMAFVGLSPEGSNPDRVAWVGLALALALPPLACALAIRRHRRTHPERASRKQRLRSRALASASAACLTTQDPERLAVLLRDYLRTWHQLPEACQTPDEIDRFLAAHALSPGDRPALLAWLRRLDRARFAGPGVRDETLGLDLSRWFAAEDRP